MRPTQPILTAALCIGLASTALAAGNGAGAGGAGSQRAINSGLPPGDPGPLGSVNNPHRPSPVPTQGSPRPEPMTQKDQ